MCGRGERPEKLKLWVARLFKIEGKERVLDAVIRSSFINLLARVSGYLKNVAIVVILGFGYQTDAFFMALSLVSLLLIFGDVFDSVGVPNLVKARLESEEEFRKLSGLLFTFTLILAFGLILIALIFLPFIMKIPVGFKGEVLKLTKNSFFLLLPYAFFYFIFHHFGAVLRSVRRFTHFFLGEFLFSFLSFLFILTGLLTLKSPYVLPVSVSIAQFLATLYMLYVGRRFLHFAFFWDKRVKALLKHFLLLSALYGVFYLYILVDRAFASLLAERSVSALTYGFMVVGGVRGILRFENISITSLSEVSENVVDKLNKYLRYLLFISLPMAFFLFLFSQLIVDLLFHYGAFSTVDAKLTATALRFYSLSLPFMFIWPVLYRVFQIKEKLGYVSALALFGVILNGLLNYLFVIELKLNITGVCLGTLGAYAFLCLSAYVILWYNEKKEVKHA